MGLSRGKHLAHSAPKRMKRTNSIMLGRQAEPTMDLTCLALVFVADDQEGALVLFLGEIPARRVSPSLAPPSSIAAWAP